MRHYGNYEHIAGYEITHDFPDDRKPYYDINDAATDKLGLLSRG